MSKIKQILKAAQQTADYVDLMRLPSAKQGVTKYAKLIPTKSGPEVQESGFVMLSPSMARNDQISNYVIGFAFAPVVTALGIVNGLNSSTRSGRLFNYGTSTVGALATLYFINKAREFSKAETLLFPQVTK